MKKISTELEEKLLDYLDGNLSDAEVRKLEEALQQSDILQARFEELRKLDQTLVAFSIEQPSRNFTDRVMLHLHQRPASSSWSIRNAIFLLAGILVAVGAAAWLASAGIFDSTTTINLQQSDLPKTFIPEGTPSFTVDGKRIVNIIIMLNIVLAWIVLDRTILRPYFHRRMESGT
ncbi:MAG TPA: hypothetical protein VIM75_07815 [Ohtaekwangia sp.]|uniref:anti-sigma factor family protein n=1 Tax=Ohtaekwangia sp. TaxID=2066019 RepID=UPI002F92A1FC